MHDFVSYLVPGGQLVNFLFVQHDVRRIFEYRARKLRDLLGHGKSPVTSATSMDPIDQ
jgi:hypothetical protein